MQKPGAREFELSDEEVAQEYDSGNGTVFLDRISWALSYLTNSGLAERPRRGVYKNTDKAQRFLNKSSEEIQQFVKDQMALRAAEQKAEQGVEDDRPELLPTSNQTPQELLNAAHESIRQSTYDQIIDTVLSKTPLEFEGLAARSNLTLNKPKCGKDSTVVFVLTL
ncbi:winged helix-turn-helix domain-containing protein [Neptuniibacter sp. 2_MG-2023]|uniref:winged helix-turn-helix domain-containing protein n=1 Tax=Neptuniibacter sp. 2_MG-2023 TaxID=3062671 RepID=UPI0026E2F5E9|nr:winged helix-turn-helix domain-containing protein [Neptuniibacter sp. 2_MG-2023]MDO6514395.1 winged helix-turn-helix domain-containing protein [Neptuniibacter sp. 2_MG-2023]